MRRSSLILSTAALTGALALVAAPALANGSGQTVDMPPWEWYIAAGDGEWGVDEGNFDDGITSEYGAWNGSDMVFLGPDYLGISSASEALEPATPAGYVPFECGTSTLSDSGADRVVACNETVTTPWGFSITSDVRVLAPGDLARITFLVTNTTSAPVTLGYEYSWSYGESAGHVRSSMPDVVQDTNDDDGFLANPDVWSYNISNINAGVAWGILGQPLLGTSSNHSGSDEGSVQLLPSAGRTVAAGDTVALAFFHKMQEPEPQIEVSAPAVDETADPTAAESGEADASEPAAMPVPQPASSHIAETPASVMAEFASFSGRLTRGLPADVTVGNWQPAAAPELADTGAGIDETLLMGGLAAALLGAGAALLIGRRVAGAARR
ncbi:hypothetical protein [Microcella sp.]|uniref:hypothetical protein n=1 Tax=Microcella sp. TaxID=1913979 RepID=UPI003F714075